MALGSTRANPNFARPLSPSSMIYKPDGFNKAQVVKQQMDDVLDNLQGIVSHVVQREEMKIRQHTNP